MKIFEPKDKEWDVLWSFLLRNSSLRDMISSNTPYMIVVSEDESDDTAISVFMCNENYLKRFPSFRIRESLTLSILFKEKLNLERILETK